jgi:hypothetical protein
MFTSLISLQHIRTLFFHFQYSLVHFQIQNQIHLRRNQQKELIGEVNIGADNDIGEKERNERVRTEDDETVAADSDDRYIEVLVECTDRSDQ